MGHLLFSGQKYRPLVRGDANSLFLGEAISLEWNQASGGEQGSLRQARVCIWAVCYRKKMRLEVKKSGVWSLVLLPTLWSLSHLTSVPSFMK